MMLFRSTLAFWILTNVQFVESVPTGCQVTLAKSECTAAAVRAALVGCTISGVVVPDDICDASVDFKQVSNEFYQYDKSFMDGGGELNDFSDQVKSLEHQAGRILRFQENVAKKMVVNWPEYDAIAGLPEVNAGQFYKRPGYMSNLDLGTCSTNAVMCCFIGDRQGTSDAAMVDNADVCGHDLGDSPESNHIANGWSSFKGDESPTYCHGFFWSADLASTSNIYKGNALFAASYLTTVTKGYSKNIPGAPLCACVDQMPIVSDAACLDTKVTISPNGVSYTFEVEEDGSVSASVEGVNVEIGNCNGKSLSAAYKESNATARQKEKMASKVLGQAECGDAEDEFLSEQFWVTGTKASPISNPDKWTQFVGEGDLYKSMPGERKFREIYAASSTGIIYRFCSGCDAAYKHLYYRRLKDFPTSFEALDMLMNSFIGGPGTGNEILIDFGLWTSYDDAKAKNLATSWKVCGYDTSNEGYGFPGKCGATAVDTRSNYNSYDPRRQDGRAQNHAFYMDK